MLERDIEGDVLILDPSKPGKHLPDIKFDKIVSKKTFIPSNNLPFRLDWPTRV